MFRVFRAVSTVIAGAGLMLAGCSVHAGTTEPTIAKADLENGVADSLQKRVGQRPDSVDCPGPVKAVAGQTARCTLTAGSTRYGLTVTVTSYAGGRAAYDVQVDNKPVSS
jgi:hypothetical protein